MDKTTKQDCLYGNVTNDDFHAMTDTDQKSLLDAMQVRRDALCKQLADLNKQQAKQQSEVYDMQKTIYDINASLTAAKMYMEHASLFKLLRKSVGGIIDITGANACLPDYTSTKYDKVYMHLDSYGYDDGPRVRLSGTIIFVHKNVLVDIETRHDTNLYIVPARAEYIQRVSSSVAKRLALQMVKKTVLYHTKEIASFFGCNIKSVNVS